MNINLMKLGGVVRALNRIAAAIERHNYLAELDLHEKGITTGIKIATKAELSETRVDYPDEEFEAVVEMMKSQGYRLGDEDLERLRDELDKTRTPVSSENGE